MKTLSLVYTGLMLLLMATVGITFIPLGAWNSAVSLLIAVGKAGLILIFFMRLRESSPSLRVVALAALLWVFFLFGLTGLDYLTRGLVETLEK